MTGKVQLQQNLKERKKLISTNKTVH